MGQEEIPIFYKGTTLSNYQEACHVLSCNNCVLLDDLFLRKGNIDAAVSNKFNEGITNIDDEEQDEESILDYFDNANAIDDFISPLKHHNDLSRFQNNIMTYFSPMTKRLHNEIQCIFTFYLSIISVIKSTIFFTLAFNSTLRLHSVVLFTLHLHSIVLYPCIQ